MKKTSQITDVDSALFREAMGDAVPLKYDSHIVEKPKPQAHPAKTQENNKAVMTELHEANFDSSMLERGDELLFCRPGVQKQTLRKLRRGFYRIEAELDLHGMTVAEAKEAFAEFLKQCTNRSQRCIRIIHGKGLGSKNKQPILKNKLNQWLLKTNSVLAFCSARPEDGGTGAVYILIRKD